MILFAVFTLFIRKGGGGLEVLEAGQLEAVMVTTQREYGSTARLVMTAPRSPHARPPLLALSTHTMAFQNLL